MQNASELPNCFVWTRYGTESGEAVASIFDRKERERLATGGTFLWGIGNSISPAVRQLLLHLRGAQPVVVFSPMLSSPKRHDVTPGRVVTWNSARGLDGDDWTIPPGIQVTSRGDVGSLARASHYALVCTLDAPLAASDSGPRFAIADLSNFASGRSVGHSQVSSVVRRVPGASTGSGPYRAAVIATLRYPYLVTLADPEQLGVAGRATAFAPKSHQMPLGLLR